MPSPGFLVKLRLFRMYFLGLRSDYENATRSAFGVWYGLHSLFVWKEFT